MKERIEGYFESDMYFEERKHTLLYVDQGEVVEVQEVIEEIGQLALFQIINKDGSVS